MIIGSKIIFIRNISSTNTFASGLLKKDPVPAEGTVIYTDYQTAGRGQRENKWESEAGKNILCSIILFPGMVAPEDQYVISMTISLGIYDFISEKVHGCKIKWPNDIYVGDSKIAGVLIENSILDGKIGSSIAGIGLNLNQTRFISGAPNPVSLKMLTGEEYDPEICLKQLIKNLDKSYKQLLAADHENIRSRFSSLLYRLNEWHSYRAGDMIFEGKIAAVTGRGNLTVVDRAGKSLEFGTKEIEYIL
ncbi:MAG TPA: biotin--[acetyl-CoA-carboxylase] ligase [Bacteroidales bacterium]|nr:biotin--[acetyl-CoA-carboxylase] ligase [Bacteroidales bacterium]HNR42333.1 biotin--[acetyl-CoA-carboxylase] ligase [Bacteroidales bacterium]HPM17576.1 biotin--[acetyl-CoA-carboxylase] ligase [Bacteroidales bacterium]HQG77660.1 biotin--[acetyl-CoA-carboxylase] ligase [Bacteroidales bacterium]